MNPFFIICLVHVIQSRDRFPIFIFEQYSISFRNLSCTTCAYRVYAVLITLCQMCIRYSEKKVLVTYVYFGIDYCAFAQVIFTVINACCLTDTAMLISELTRFDSFYIFSTELLVFLQCWQTGKEFRLPWHRATSSGTKVRNIVTKVKVATQ